jgi:sigma-B regulation protein RsbU (phosphoserine phosphatase)
MLGSGTVNYSDLMKRVEQVVAAIDHAEDIGATIQAVANGVVIKFSEQLGIFGGRIYQRKAGFYELTSTFGDAKRLPSGMRIPIEYPPIQAVLGEGAVLMAGDDHRVDPGIESRLGVDEFAAVEVGDHDKYFVLAFDVAPGQDQTEILFSLSILRHSINHKIRQGRLNVALREARLIQASILPRQLPSFENFDIFGRTESMEFVGGDFYDFIPLTA